MNDFTCQSLSLYNGHAKKYVLFQSEQKLSYGEVLDLWESDSVFLDFLCDLFIQCGLRSYVWETPSISTDSLDRDFEFVLISKPPTSSGPDRDTFKPYFNPQCPDNGVVTFPNLGRDAYLVVPTPLEATADYSDMALFFRYAPVPQQYALWTVLSKVIKSKLKKQKLWVSVAGGGVSWLHIRVDDLPKYYRHLPYSTQR